jgi:pimeloyl-ACP methyl ester carboxylesterase
MVILAGSHDRIVGVDGHAVWFHEAIPGSELQVIPGAGHMFHYAALEQVAAAIAAVADGRRTGEPDPAGTPPTGKIETRPAA